MIVKIMYELNDDDIKKMPFQVFNEYCTTGQYKYFTQQRLLKENFSAEEIKKIFALKGKACRVCKNTPSKMLMSVDEYSLWERIGKYLYENWCIK